MSLCKGCHNDDKKEDFHFYVSNCALDMGGIMDFMSKIAPMMFRNSKFSCKTYSSSSSLFSFN